MKTITHPTDLDDLRRTSAVYAVVCAWAHNGLFDAPTDPICAHSESIAEHTPICGDGVDNDGDGAVDLDDPAGADHTTEDRG